MSNTDWTMKKGVCTYCCSAGASPQTHVLLGWAATQSGETEAEAFQRAIGTRVQSKPWAPG